MQRATPSFVEYIDRSDSDTAGTPMHPSLLSAGGAGGGEGARGGAREVSGGCFGDQKTEFKATTAENNEMEAMQKLSGNVCQNYAGRSDHLDYHAANRQLLALQLLMRERQEEELRQLHSMMTKATS